MSKIDVKEYKKKLLEERERLHREIELLERDISYDDTRMGQSELADYDQHPADTGTDTFEKEKDVSIVSSLRGRIGRIDEALGKIERTTYGYCDRCGREITKERLDAMPDAIYCVRCQDIIEGR